MGEPRAPCALPWRCRSDLSRRPGGPWEAGCGPLHARRRSPCLSPQVLSTVRSGKEEEEIRLVPRREEQVNIFLFHVAIFSLHLKLPCFK